MLTRPRVERPRPRPSDLSFQKKNFLHHGWMSVSRPEKDEEVEGVLVRWTSKPNHNPKNSPNHSHNLNISPSACYAQEMTVTEWRYWLLPVGFTSPGSGGSSFNISTLVSLINHKETAQHLFGVGGINFWALGALGTFPQSFKTIALSRKLWTTMDNQQCYIHNIYIID